MVKNLEKKTESIQQQKLGNRGNKKLRDAKLKAVGAPCFREGNNPYCKVCKDGGSLIMCGHCSRSYHLHCANMQEQDIPAGTWFCPYCVQFMEKKLKDEYTKLEKSEKHHKESKLKHFSGKVNIEQNDITVRWFEKKYPEYVKQGKIQYPIADELIQKECELSQTPLPPPLPLPQPIYPIEDVGDLFFIVDFVYNFGKMLKVTPFTVDQLFYAANSNSQTPLIKELHMALISFLIGHVLSRENTYEILNEDSRFLYSAAQLSEFFELNEFLPFSWLPLLDELIHLPIFKDYADERIMDLFFSDQNKSDLETNYFKCSYKEKIGVILLLINCLFDVKEMHEELARRLEAKGELIKQKTKLNATIKDNEATLPEINGLAATRKAASIAEKIQKTQNKIEELNRKLESIRLRTNPVGLDRDYNEYYIFEWDPKNLYVKMISPIEENSSVKTKESGHWYSYTRSSSLDQLLQCLCPKGIREHKLIEGINKGKRKLKLINGDDSSTSSEDIKPQSKGGAENYVNKESSFKNEDCTIEILKKMLLSIEKKFTRHLKKSGKLWENYERVEEWKEEVSKAEDPSALASLLLEHSQKSTSPLKLSSSSSDQSQDSDEEQVYTKKYRKVTIRIWQDFGDYYQLWENLTQSITTLGQLALVIGIYQKVLNLYIEKKNEAASNEAEVKKKAKQEEKRVLRSEVKNVDVESSNSEEDIKHGDSCYFCDDGGRLICCETCPKVVHPECLGLTKVPKEDWYCDECKYKQQNVPQTRLKSRLRKNIQN
ncbi:unnamed protein product [Blepharisma stoltei]|uniref:Uncharacterized protein n=1 Tax=Blepharisma stoltei TaxID=1481888 RepID=A0AAU9JXA3_9CILI|nr:unnamed protein product [Blepharisma stoltei]